MRHFFKDLLEPVSYLVYVVAIAINLYIKNTPRRKWLLGYYATAAILIFIATYETNVNLNRVLYNLFFVLTIIVLYVYFKQVLIERIAKIVVNGLFIINLLLFVADILLAQKFTEINSIFYATIYLTISIYVFFHFAQLIKNVTEVNILQQFDFYLSAGYILYFLSCFIIILTYKHVNVGQRYLLYSIQNTVLFLASLITLVGSWRIYKLTR